MNQKLKRFLQLAFIILGIHLGIILYFGLFDSVTKADIIVILGNKVELNGEPSVRLITRLNRGIQLYKDGYAPHIFVSGGIGKEGFDEAIVMKDFLLNAGIKPEDIIVDSNGNNTSQTGQNLKKYMDQNNYNSVIAVSNYYHMLRIKMYFNQIGIPNVYTAHAYYFELRDFYSILREIAGLYAYGFGK